MVEQDFNSEPVFYCKHCLSLNIKSVDDSIDTDYLDFCDECGSTDIGYINIFDWEKMYKEKYNIDF